MTGVEARNKKPYEKSAARTALATRLLDAGVEILRTEGMGLGAESLSFRRVFEYVKERDGEQVNPGSVYDRLWIDVRQYQLEVLARAARKAAEGDQHLEWTSTDDAITSVVANSDLSTPESRRQASVQLVRQGGGANAAGVLASASWGLWASIWALYNLDRGRSAGPGADEIGESLAGGLEAEIDHWKPLYESFIELLDLRFRPPYDDNPEASLDHLVRLVNALAAGMAPRRHFDPENFSAVKLPTGPDGTTEEWELFAVGMMAIVDGMLEPAEPADPTD